MSFFGGKKKSKKVTTTSSDVIEERPSSRKTLSVGGKEYYLSIKEIEGAPLNLTISLDDIETNKSCHILTIDLGDKQINNPDEYIPIGCAYLDTKRNHGVLEFLKKHHICDVYKIDGEEQYSPSPLGDTEYPLCVFYLSRLDEYDYDGVMRYEQNYNKELVRLKSLPSSYIIKQLIDADKQADLAAMGK